MKTNVPLAAAQNEAEASRLLAPTLPNRLARSGQNYIFELVGAGYHAFVTRYLPTRLFFRRPMQGRNG
jgi:hypothetical protein